MLRRVLALLLIPFTAAADPALWTSEFPLTNFDRTSVQWSEIMSGGPPRDGIPALSDPDMIPVGAADIPGREPVMVLEVAGAPARAYPLRYLIWHEIANDMVGDLPVAVTFCPLCNSAMAFDRRHKGRVLTFGVTGKLRASDMIMYDRETETWWQQALGVAIVGDFMGDALVQLPTWTESFAAFAGRHPAGLVMAEPAMNRWYGDNPYVGYDSRDRPYPFYTGDAPPHDIPALARVVRVGNRAWPITRLGDGRSIEEAGVTITWVGTQASALGAAQIAQAADVGAIRVRDGSGADVPHDVLFAFAFHALYPDGEWMID